MYQYLLAVLLIHVVILQCCNLEMIVASVRILNFLVEGGQICDFEDIKTSFI